MDIRTYYVPWETGVKSLAVDLDSREPLRDDQVEALLAAQSRAIEDKIELEERIQKIGLRLHWSVEAKLTAMREGDNGKV